MMALWLLLHALGYDIDVASAQPPAMISVANMVASMPLVTTAFSRTRSGCPARNSECTYAVDASNVCIVSTQSDGLRFNSLGRYSLARMHPQFPALRQLHARATPTLLSTVLVMP
eukprot:2654119-Amphidinium_carterae.1